MSATKLLSSEQQRGEAHLRYNHRADVLRKVIVQTKWKFHGVGADAWVWADVYVARSSCSLPKLAIQKFDLNLKTETYSTAIQT